VKTAGTQPVGVIPGSTTKHPDNVRVADVGEPHGYVIQMTGDEQLMGRYGVELTSERMPVKPNTRCRCTGYTKSAGPKMIVFVKGYATVTRRVQGEVQTFEDAISQMRKDIEPSPD
jgi:hypothetical protein